MCLRTHSSSMKYCTVLRALPEGKDTQPMWLEEVLSAKDGNLGSQDLRSAFELVVGGLLAAACAVCAAAALPAPPTIINEVVSGEVPDKIQQS